MYCTIQRARHSPPHVINFGDIWPTSEPLSAVLGTNQQHQFPLLPAGALMLAKKFPQFKEHYSMVDTIETFPLSQDESSIRQPRSSRHSSTRKVLKLRLLGVRLYAKIMSQPTFIFFYFFYFFIQLLLYKLSTRLIGVGVTIRTLDQNYREAVKYIIHIKILSDTSLLTPHNFSQRTLPVPLSL